MELFEKSDFQPIKTFALLFIKIGIRRESELSQLTKFLVKCLFLAPKNPIFFSLFSQNLHQIFSGLSKERIWNPKNCCETSFLRRMTSQWLKKLGLIPKWSISRDEMGYLEVKLVLWYFFDEIFFGSFWKFLNIFNFNFWQVQFKFYFKFRFSLFKSRAIIQETIRLRSLRSLEILFLLVFCSQKKS